LALDPRSLTGNKIYIELTKHMLKYRLIETQAAIKSVASLIDLELGG